MTFSTIFALFSAMIILAALPSVSVLAVATRSATSGFKQGIFTTLGIVAGDIIFILIVLQGLVLLVNNFGNLFSLIKYLGAAYLIFLGIRLFRAKPQTLDIEKKQKSSTFASFLTGLSITLADQKATLFYLGFFPAFLDLTQITWGDTLIIIGITILAVGGVKLIYAFLALQARQLINPQTNRKLNILAGSMMIVAALFLLIKN
ncbi:MAG: LysE family translocator [Spirulinaceae cyanobacterium]